MNSKSHTTLSTANPSIERVRVQVRGCSISPNSSLVYMIIFCIILGSVSVECRAEARYHAYIFNQYVMNGKGKTSKVDGVWCIVIGLSLIPAFGTLYQRAESTHFIKLQNTNIELNHTTTNATHDSAKEGEAGKKNEPTEAVEKKRYFRAFINSLLGLE
ncbi:hypothetical protein DFH07DRAFT_769703 [Mycena maculata]|uniref:Uncharacterized protein n=1 Tax=Mycena maculata TaxID=230809 RepID=A0AAD7JKV9_9AGAR|nr:hypothetical protein DFH07DRAFT_769703 [Mycena maculata]